MNTLTKEQCRKLVRENGLDWQRGYGVGEDDTNYFEFLINAAFALGVAHGEANRTAVQEKAERLERMLLDKPSILASSTSIREGDKL